MALWSWVAALNVVNAAYPVYPVSVVLRTSDVDQRRVLDPLSGWALGSNGDVPGLEHSLVLQLAARPARKSGIVSAIEEASAGDGPQPLIRERRSG
jgi:hypothetical protein